MSGRNRRKHLLHAMARNANARMESLYNNGDGWSDRECRAFGYFYACEVARMYGYTPERVMHTMEVEEL